MKIVASIVTYRTDGEELRHSLSMLLMIKGMECVDVVDNSSLERIRLVCEEFDQVNYIPMGNVGYGAGHNVSLRRSLSDGTRYHLVINSDLEFDPKQVDLMIGRMEQEPRIGLMHPLIVNPDGTPQYTARQLPTPMDLILRRFMPGWMCRRSRDRYLLKHLNHSKELNVPYVQGSFMLIRTDALRDVGLFDERFFMYPEDIDLTRRLHRRWLTLSSPLATVVHQHRAASYHSARMLWIHLVNMVRYFNKYGWIADSERRRINKELR